MNSLLAAIQTAIRSGTPTDVNGGPDPLGENEPGAGASLTQPPPTGATQNEVLMSKPSATNGAALAGAEILAGMAAAHEDAKVAGFKAANERLGTILGAVGIKGDGGRMAAALDLALASPDMTAEAVTAFVSANVAASTKTEPQPQADAYEQRRLAAAGLAQPQAGGGQSAPKANIDRNAIFSARRAQNGKGA